MKALVLSWEICSSLAPSAPAKPAPSFPAQAVLSPSPAGATSPVVPNPQHPSRPPANPPPDTPELEPPSASPRLCSLCVCACSARPDRYLVLLLKPPSFRPLTLTSALTRARLVRRRAYCTIPHHPLRPRSPSPAPSLARPPLVRLPTRATAVPPAGPFIARPPRHRYRLSA